MRHQIKLSLVQIMACRLFGAKPLSEPILNYHQLSPYKHNTVKHWYKYKSFHRRKCPSCLGMDVSMSKCAQQITMYIINSPCRHFSNSMTLKGATGGLWEAVSCIADSTRRKSIMRKEFLWSFSDHIQIYSVPNRMDIHPLNKTDACAYLKRYTLYCDE